MKNKELLKSQIQQTILESEDPAEEIIACIIKNRKEEAKIWFVLICLVCLIFIGDKIISNKKQKQQLINKQVVL